MFAAIYALTGLVLLRILYTLCYRVYSSPLSKIPGPTVSSVTKVWLMYKEFSGYRRSYIHELHNVYGPVVRIAPDEVSFATADAAKQIYTVGGIGFEKTEFYDLFINFGARNMFSTGFKVEHSERRRRVADRYAKTFIMQHAIIAGIEERARAFISEVTRSSASANIYVHLHCYALDCITHHLFHPFGTHSIEDPEDLKKMHELSYHDSTKARYFQYYSPRLSKILQQFSSLFRYSKGSKLVTKYVLETCDKIGVEDYTVLSKLQSLKDTVPPLEIASECMDHVLAGIDTTGDALCFLIWHLSLPEAVQIQERLRSELSQSADTPVDDLPYLDAVIKEGLRLYGPIPMSLPRRVPEGGRVLEGYYLPGGTIVSCQAWTLHQLDAETFPNPKTFIPERWLEESGRVERNRLFFAFATGGTGCIGKHLALMEMKILLKELYSTYSTTVAPNMTADMEISDQIISSRPKDQMCLINFEEIL